MIDFHEDFFQEEIRDGFLVSEIMKRSWAAHLKIFDKLRELMDKYGLTYYAHIGTALGACRHKGFIPWDDDIDIALFRKDYMTLLEHADEIGEGLCIRSVYNTDSYMQFHAVATHKADTLDWDEERMREYYGCPFICYVDIYPLDYLPRDSVEYQTFKELYYFAYRQIYNLMDIEDEFFGGKLVDLKAVEELAGSGNPGYDKAKAFLGELEHLKIHVRNHLGNELELGRGKSLRHQLCLVVEKVAQMCDEKDADVIEYCPRLAIALTNIHSQKSWYGSVVQMPFETTMINMPVDYKANLESIYGPDYMTPRRGSAGHDYPFFRSEVQALIGGDTGDNYLKGVDADILTSSEWKNMVFRRDGSKRKVTIIGLSATDILNRGSQGIWMIRDYLETLEKSSEDELGVVFAPGGVMNFMDRCGLALKKDYLKLVEDLAAWEKVIFDDRPDSEEICMLLSVADEYHGDRCRLADLCSSYGIPVTIIGY